jgi:hypothetical protein
VVWTESSVGPEGGFVREEATRAKARGVLVPVRLDAVSPPLGFGEIQAIDLTRWRGSARDAHFNDLVEACQAKIEGRGAKAARGPSKRLVRRAAIGSFAGTALAFTGAMATNVLHVQDHICAIPVYQPQVSDFCGSLHMGGQPSREERLAWAARPAGSCAALRTLIARFPDGAYRSKAADLLAGATMSRAPDFSPQTRTAQGYVRQSEQGFSSVAAAQADARTRAAQDAAETSCAPLNADERLDGADVSQVRYDCRASPTGGQVCAADYTAQCRLETHPMVEHCG